jgi:hypothetical protein
MNWRWLQHAFAVEPAGPAFPTEPQRAAVDTLCREIVRRKLTVPTVMCLESARPLNFVGAQALQFFAPFFSVVSDSQLYFHLAEFLERRGAIDYICNRLETWDETPGADTSAAANAEHALRSGNSA